MPNGHTISNLTKVQNLTDNINVTQAVNLDQHANAVSNLASAIEIDSNGDTLLKSASGNKIQFYNSGNQLFSSIDIKTLTDNIVISQPVNLDQTELNIATNFSNINGIMNNTQTSTLKTAVDTNTTVRTTNSSIVNNILNLTQPGNYKNVIDANTAKTGISSSQAAAITANTAKTGITSSQASAIVTNTAKTGITSSQSTDIANAKAELLNINIQPSTLLYNF